MKTIITLLTTTMLIAGVTSAMAANQQASDEAADNPLSRQVSVGFGGAYASAQTSRHIERAHRTDVQLDARN